MNHRAGHKSIARSTVSSRRAACRPGRCSRGRRSLRRARRTRPSRARRRAVLACASRARRSGARASTARSSRPRSWCGGRRGRRRGARRGGRARRETQQRRRRRRTCAARARLPDRSTDAVRDEHRAVAAATPAPLDAAHVERAAHGATRALRGRRPLAVWSRQAPPRGAHVAHTRADRARLTLRSSGRGGTRGMSPRPASWYSTKLVSETDLYRPTRPAVT